MLLIPVFHYRGVEGRRLVEMVFEGLEPPRAPLHVESDDKAFESSVSDVVGAGAKIADWRSFYERGGPFRRHEGEGLDSWLDRVDVSGYGWPDPADVVSSAIESFSRRVKGLVNGKFVMLKVLGPTEISEAFFAAPACHRCAELGQVSHRFGFGVFYTLRRSEAGELYGRIASYVLEVVRAGAELGAVDAVRVADDAAAYTGPLYSRSFYEELYFPWHRKFAEAVHKAGKFAVLHCDGDLRKGGLLKRLLQLYDAFHPLDLAPKSTPREALAWSREVAGLRAEAGEAVFFTGAPVDLLFDDAVSSEDFLEVPLTLLRLHGRRYLVLATTHSEYPLRSYREESPRRKLEALLAALKAGR